jgi:predicted RNase H-like HicB family nuclease
MKPSFTTTLSRPPKGDDEEEAVGMLLAVITQVFAAKMGSKTPIPLMQDYDQIMATVADCSRMTAFISFQGHLASLEIAFSEGKMLVRKLMFSYYFNPRQLIFAGQLMCN